MTEMATALAGLHGLSITAQLLLSLNIDLELSSGQTESLPWFL